MSHISARKSTWNEREAKCGPSDAERACDSVRTRGYLKLCAGPLAPSPRLMISAALSTVECVTTPWTVFTQELFRQCLFSFSSSLTTYTWKWLTVVLREISQSNSATFLSSTPNSQALGKGSTPKWGKWKKKWANSDQNSWTEKAITSSRAQQGIYLIDIDLELSFNIDFKNFWNK